MFTVAVQAGIMLVPGFACSDRMDMIVMMNMLFRRRQRLPVMSHMLRPSCPRHNQCAQEESEDEKAGHSAGIAAWPDLINWRLWPPTCIGEYLIGVPRNARRQPNRPPTKPPQRWAKISLALCLAEE